MKSQVLLPVTLSVFAFFNLQTANAQNTAYGSGALVSNTTGAYNTAFGYRAMYSNTTGGYNTAVGYTLYMNTTGHNNVAVGHASLFSNVNGYHNTAVGSGALTYNTSGYQNTGVGMYSLQQNTTGIQNTAQGAFSLYYNHTGSGNTAAGYQSLYSNSNGTGNTANGFTALYANTTGNNNTAIGYRALNHNTTGSGNVATGVGALIWNTIGNNNAAYGNNALYSNTKASNNAVLGYRALFKDTTGSNNTAVGTAALYAVTKSGGNTALGYNAGATYNYSECTFLGAKTTTSVGGLSNVTVIGYNATASSSNQVRIGNTSVTSIGGPVGWSTISDGRYKNQIQEDVPGLAFINKLHPISYHLDVEKIDQALRGNETKQTMDVSSLEDQNAQQQQAKMKYTGFVAQEVEKSAKELNYDFSGVDKPKNEQDLYGLRYDAFVVPLVKAVQELSKENDELKERVTKLEALLNDRTPVTNASVNNIILEQNIPNPFRGTTSIRYSIPPGFQRAQLLVTDKLGKMLKQVSLSSSSGTVNINGSLLSGGTYQYSLVIDGQTLVTKTMVIEK